MQIHINPDINLAHTLPAEFYRSQEVFEACRSRIFARSWHWVAEVSAVQEPGQVWPYTLLPGVLNEPLLFSRDRQGRLHHLSNVCTHRGKVLVEAPGQFRKLSCGYHGRCFDLDGRFRSMPEFEGVQNFPSEADHLPAVPLAEWNGLLFSSLRPALALEELLRPIQERLHWLPLHTLRHQPAEDRDFVVQANWALYCDNYLEGLHIPFVHPALNQAIEFAQYEYELFPHGNLQIGIAKAGEPCFQVPADAPDAGRSVYAYYFWAFPNLMFNIYPWGLSLNVVEPLSKERTQVRFRTYYFPGLERGREANSLDDTEYEDEAVVESVQLGIQSSFYQRGRYSPSQERCVHHFHRLLAEWLGA
jgi:choline monooxygenase